MMRSLSLTESTFMCMNITCCDCADVMAENNRHKKWKWNRSHCKLHLFLCPRFLNNEFTSLAGQTTSINNSCSFKMFTLTEVSLGMLTNVLFCCSVFSYYWKYNLIIRLTFMQLEILLYLIWGIHMEEPSFELNWNIYQVLLVHS